MPVLRIVTYGQPDAVEALARIRNRFARQLSEAPATARAKTRDLFGEPLTPVESVRRIVEAVRQRGDDALLDFAEKLDGLRLRPEELRVPEEEILGATARVEPALLETLAAAAANIRRFQEAIRLADPPRWNFGDRRLGVVYRPVGSAGIYVPGGAAAYPSTVLMSAIPAQVAGVRRIALVSPPGRDGRHPPVILAAARIAGVNEIYRVGGPHAVAALAFGTNSIPRVDKIVGPGNVYVTLAKKEILGAAGIDILAGPSETVVLADETANPAWVAADLLSQAEHDAVASSLLVTPSAGLAARVAAEVDVQMGCLRRAPIAMAALRDYGLAIVVPGLKEGTAVVNDIAPEHLEILCQDPESVARDIWHAGAIFLGPHTPEAVGDYLAGTSHVLPTGGTARFFSGLSVNDFLNRSSILEYSPAALRKESEALSRFARAEGLEAHAKSVEIRRD